MLHSQGEQEYKIMKQFEIFHVSSQTRKFFMKLSLMLVTVTEHLKAHFFLKVLKASETG